MFNCQSCPYVKKLFLALIRFYQYAISPLLPPTCRYSPTCSQYAVEAISIYGPVKGTWLALKRLSRCHPGYEGGYDPVPLKNDDEDPK